MKSMQIVRITLSETEERDMHVPLFFNLDKHFKLWKESKTTADFFQYIVRYGCKYISYEDVWIAPEETNVPTT